MRTKHGLSKTPEYTTWRGMIRRCTKKSYEHYDRYGGRGIIVCDRWMNSFIAFLEDMGKRPFPKAQIDRKRSNGNYEKDNCRWVTSEINNQNKSNCKMNPEIVLLIRSDYKIDDSQMLAEKYNCSQRTIQLVFMRKIWRNI